MIKVKIDGYEYDVHKKEFTSQEAIYKNGEIHYQDVLQVTQYPLVLAYAITIHKSQGMTYQKVACDISNCFSAGQAYVALSRCSSLDGLYLLEKLSNNSTIQVDPNVRDFYLNLIN
jgi:ATP-dependent exoDNAse (exonuclease V) alpha subunit